MLDVYSQITRDRSAMSLNITQATPQQVTNANLANFCYQAWLRLSKLEGEQGSAVYSSLESSVQVRTVRRRQCIPIDAFPESSQDLRRHCRPPHFGYPP